MPQRRAYLKGISAALGAGGLATIAGCLGDDTASYVVGGGGEGSGAFATGQSFQSVVNDHSDEINLSVQTTGGTLANKRQLGNGEVHIASSSNYLLGQALDEEGEFGDEPLDTIPYQGWRDTVGSVWMVQREGLGLDSYYDMEGMNVWPMWEAAGLRLPGELLLRELGIWDEFDEVPLDTGDIAGALEEGSVDVAMIYTVDGSVPGWLTEVDARIDLEILPMDDEIMDELDEMDIPPRGTLDLDEIDGFENNFQDVGEIPVWEDEYQMFITEDFEDDHAYHLLDLLHEHHEEVRDVDDGAIHYDDPEMIAETTNDLAPVHPGVAEWYEDHGVWDDSWTTEW